MRNVPSDNTSSKLEGMLGDRTKILRRRMAHNLNDYQERLSTGRNSAFLGILLTENGVNLANERLSDLRGRFRY
jgi:hypothetical protein